jgi:hypothetical protein
VTLPTLLEQEPEPPLLGVMQISPSWQSVTVVHEAPGPPSLAAELHAKGAKGTSAQRPMTPQPRKRKLTT